jgi:hypothetical protein
MESKFVSFAEKPLNLGVEAPTDKAPEPYYPSISVPEEVFDGEAPKVGSTVELVVRCEVESVSKDKQRGLQTRLKVLSGQVQGDVSEEEFKKLDDEDQRDVMEKDFENRMGKDKLEEYE